MQELFPENSKNAQQVNGVRRNLMKKKNNICLMHFRCAFGVIRTEKKK